MAQQLTPEFGENGSLQKLNWGGQQCIHPWGLEMADAHSFFSLETGGWDNDAAVLSQKNNRTHTENQLKLDMREGHWQLDWGTTVTETAVQRAASFTALANGWAMDFVMRFVFQRTAVTHAAIANQTIVWDGANYYHQYPAQSVTLFHGQGQIKIGVDAAEFPSDWQQVMYVRCSPQEDAWIVHLRLLPRQWSREIIKLRLIGARHAVLPSAFGRLLNLWPRLEAHLRYAGEFNRFNLGRINAIPINFVPRRTQFTLAATVQFSSS
jgi:hypothetical protein